MRPSQREEMAEKVVKERGVSISVACRAFGISLRCYRYNRKLSDENAEIADWLERLTTAQKTSRLWSKSWLVKFEQVRKGEFLSEIGIMPDDRRDHAQTTKT